MLVQQCQRITQAAKLRLAFLVLSSQLILKGLWPFFGASRMG
jgi:hypothetical protein